MRRPSRVVAWIGKVVAALIFLCLLANVAFVIFLKWGLAARPKLVYEGDFTTPIAKIHRLDGGGFAFHGHDAWIRFESEGEVDPKEGRRFVPMEAEKARAWFLKIDPKDRDSLEDARGLSCVSTRDETLGTSNGKWLCRNPRTGVYLFRSWDRS